MPFDLESAPKLERKADPPKEKKKAKPAEASGSAAPPAEEKKSKKEKKDKAPAAAEEPAKVAEAAPASKAPKKEKKEKKPADEGSSKKGGNAKPAAEDAGEPVPSMIDLRVGHIVDSERTARVKSLIIHSHSFTSHEASRRGRAVC